MASEQNQRSYLLEKLWRSMLDGNPVIPDDAGKESDNYYLQQIIQTLVQYGGIKGMANVDGINLPTVSTVPVVFSSYVEENTRNLEQHFHGNFEQIVTGATFNSGSPINDTNGLGKLFFSFNAGADVSGSLTITGTSVNRNTGVETPADTDVLTVSTLTTDNSDTDAEGNPRYSFTDGLMSTKWFKGAFTVSTSDLSFTDVDIWNIAFEQVNDSPVLELTTVDMTMYSTNASSWFYGYLYVVDVKDNQLCDISRDASLELPVADTAADLSYRLRKGNIGVTLDGTTDGFWFDAQFGPNSLTYWKNINLKIWFNVGINLS